MNIYFDILKQAFAVTILNQMSSRYTLLVQAYQLNEVDFKNLADNTIKNAGNVNTASGRCTTENLSKLLKNFRNVFENLIPEQQSVVSEYGNKANIF